MTKVIVHRHVVKYLNRLPKETKQRILEILKKLEDNPLGQSNVKHMVGEWAGYHRIRVGNLRSSAMSKPMISSTWITSAQKVIFTD